MSGKKTNAELRAHWYELGVRALQAARPGAPRMYGCPQCLQGFPPDCFSLEDVPPKSVGGKPLVLTCTQCNTRSGAKLDIFIAETQRLKDFVAGREVLRVDLTQYGRRIAADASLSDARLSLTGVRKASNKESFDGLFAELDPAARERSRDWDFSIKFQIRNSPWKEGVAWLRLAYLYAFAAFGYNFILRPGLHPVREQIKHPEKRVTPGVVKHVKDPSDHDGISFVHEPVSYRSILVRLGGHFVFLPDFNHADGFFERMERLPEDNDPVRLAGYQLDLPRSPQFLFDFRPEMMQLTVPGKTRNKIAAVNRAVGRRGACREGLS